MRPRHVAGCCTVGSQLVDANLRAPKHPDKPGYTGLGSVKPE